MIDTNSFDLTKSIELILKYIKEILKNNGKVFIHCSKVYFFFLIIFYLN